MTNLSPAAQAVKEAVLALYGDSEARKMAWPLERESIITALRTAANHAIPTSNARYSLLRVADELEAQ